MTNHNLHFPELDFNDVMIQPQRSTNKSRKLVSVTRKLTFRHSSTEWTGYPVIAANMLTGTFEMARELAKFGMLTALHKYYSLEDLLYFWMNDYGVAQNNTFYTLGIRDEDLKKYNAFKTQLNEAPKFVCIDIANGHIEIFVDFVRQFRQDNPNVVIMAGNIVTGSAAEELILAGADIVKVGIGSGANCTTRRVTGVGRPQLSAVLDCADKAHGLRGRICSDGGIVVSGDMNIAFCAGADFVMIGTMFSGTDECAGEVVEYNGKFHKKFFGMSSKSAQAEFDNGKGHRHSEGRTTLIPMRGSVKYIAESLIESTESMLSYIGATELREAARRATLQRVNTRLNSSVEHLTIGD